MKRFWAICIIGAIAAAVVVTVSCTGDPFRENPNNNGGNGGESNTLTGVNEWIYDELGDWYYWNDAVKTATPPSNSLDYDEFLSNLLIKLQGAQDNTENPPTMDGGNKASRGGRYVYSNIERFDVASTRAEKGEEGIRTTFGFDAEGFIIGGSNSNPQIGLMVLWVLPDGPADKAGIKRGMWITKYNGADIYNSNYETFWNQLNLLEGEVSMTVTEYDFEAQSDGKVYPLTAETMKVSPIIEAEVLETQKGKKAAYLVYNEFDMGAGNGTNGGEFDDELREVFAGFKDAGATELILDLRYNPGGDLTSCQVLTSLAGNVDSEDIFAKLLFNDELATENRWANPEVLHFMDEQAGLNLDKVYVIATESSASASEMVISSLRGALGNDAVVHIGTRTEGKNVGMNMLQTTIGKYYYEMWPITFKIMNAVDFCDYAGGFEPDYPKDEFYDITEDGGSGVVYQLGDPRERLLDAALTRIDGGTVTPDPDAATRSSDALVTVPKLYNPRRGGARIYEFPKPVAETDVTK